MANHVWIYFIKERELASHEVVVETQESIIRKSNYPSLFAMLGIIDKVVKKMRKDGKPTSGQSSGKAIPHPD